ncbi:MAG TPA: Zn-dependent hydrolase [Burkholderiales bacterium]|nr:Zn-dependent hydrolase [Burkholderiales bacterium]
MNDTTTREAGTLAGLHIDGDRLWRSLMDLAAIGATPLGGVRRIALTDLDRQGRDQVVAWFRAAGLEVRVDPIGNIFGRRPGRDANRPPVLAGSHIDTQPSGGKFDGNYGVLAGLEVVRTLNDRRIATEAPVEVAVWTNEEGTRFTPVMMGSGVFAGVHPLDEVLARTDIEGRAVIEELRRIGYAGSAPLGTPVGAYFEAHIEQGPVLEDTRRTIGVVTGALGQRWYDVTVTGMNAHAGPTPMRLRKDALLAASRLVGEVNRIALEFAPDGRGTVGFMQVSPNSRNVVPGEAKLSVDFRHATDDGLAGMDRALRAASERVARESNVAVVVKEAVYFAPCAFDAACVRAVRTAAGELGLSNLDIVSGAGHDAVYVARVAPAAMIFVPCKDGVSHNEIEDAAPSDLAAGCDVLARAMLARAGVAA